MINKIIQEIKNEYTKSKITVLFMGTVVLLALLTYIKPGSTDSVLGYIGITAINFIVISAIIFMAWLFWWRKR